MTTFEDLERDDIAWASDPLSEKGRPMLILGVPHLPNYDTQLITVLLSTKTYHEEALALRDGSYNASKNIGLTLLLSPKGKPPVGWATAISPSRLGR